MAESKDEIEIDFSKIKDKFKGLFDDKKDSGSSEDSLELDLGGAVDKIKKYSKSEWFYYILLAPILYLGVWIRTRNLNLLQGKYLLGLDPYYFYRLTKILLDKGTYGGAIDYMRNAPVGYPYLVEDFFPNQLAYAYKFFKIFGLSQMEWHVIYPVVAAAVGFLFFYLFAKEYFNARVALVSTLFLVVVPAYLFRTIAGFADHEAMAMVWMFASLYLFVLFRKERVTWKKLSLGGLSGIAAGLMSVTWSGYPMLLIPIASLVLVEILFERVDKKYFVGYLLFFTIFFIIRSSAVGMMVAFKNYGVYLLAFGLVSFIVYILLSKIDFKIYNKFPKSLFSISLVGLFGFIIVSGLGFINIGDLIAILLSPAHGSKVDLTTSELATPFVFGGHSLWGAFGWTLVFSFLGSVLLMYFIFKKHRNIALLMSGLYGILFGLSFFGRYSSNLQLFNKSYVYLLSLFIVFFMVLYLYLYNKKQELFENLVKDADTLLVLALVGFAFTAILARSAVRFFFIVAPFVSLASGYFVVKSSEILYRKQSFRWASIGLTIFAIFIVFNLASTSAVQASGYGSGLPGQWESSMHWIRDNTAEDAIISHWWDYGYWTQAVGERASVEDGAKPGGDYGIFTLARYGMTAHDPKDALTYFKTRNVTHVLYSEEEIGKYHAFSFLGSDENDDRRSTIGTFGLSQSQEVRKGYRKMYTGGWGFDEDVVLDNLVLPEGESVIAGFFVDVDENNVIKNAPLAVVISKGRQIELPISCAYVGEGREKLTWEVNNSIGGCIVMLPAFEDSGKVTDDGAIFYLSDKVEPGLFAQLYILNEDIEGFKEVYRDNTPLGVYNGRVIGPIVIWELNYPDHIKEDSVFLSGTSEEFERSYGV